MKIKEIEVPPAWEEIDAAPLRGTLLVIGPPDAGKSTFVDYLVGRMHSVGVKAAQVDGDPGQSRLGPPTTLTMVYKEPVHDQAEQDLSGSPKPANYQRRSFTGAITPVGHMLETLTSGVRLVKAAYQAGAETVVYDTCGLVDPRAGGLALKKAKIDLLQPALVFALQRRDELQSLITPLHLSRRTQVITLKPVSQARRRSAPVRQEHRARRFARYFNTAQNMEMDWSQVGVFPYPTFFPGRLVALEDRHGFTLDLGIVTRVDPRQPQVTLLTPHRDLRDVTAIHLGSVQLDPASFRTTPIPFSSHA